MTLSELNTLLTGLWGKVKNYITTTISTLVTKSELASYNPIIEDTRASAVAAITGVAPFSELVDGQRITIHFNYITVNNGTIELTLSNGTKTGAIPAFCIIRWVNQWLGVQRIQTYSYGVGNYIEFIYDAENNRWVGGVSDTNTTYNNLTQENLTAGTSTTQNTITAKLLRDNFYLKSEVDALIPDTKIEIVRNLIYGTADYVYDYGSITASDIADGLDTQYNGWRDDAVDLAAYNTITANPQTNHSGVRMSRTMLQALNSIGIELDERGAGAFMLENWAEEESSLTAVYKVNISSLDNGGYNFTVNYLTSNFAELFSADHLTEFDAASGIGEWTLDNEDQINAVLEALTVAETYGYNVNYTISAYYLLEPNTKFYDFGSVSSLSVALSAGESGVVNVYMFSFTCSTASPTLELPSGILTANGQDIEDDFAEGRTFEITIRDNKMSYIYFDEL